MSTTGYVVHANAKTGGSQGRNKLFHYAGKWWAVMKETVDNDFKLWESDSTIPPGQGDTGGWNKAILAGGGDVEFHSQDSARGQVWMDVENNRLHTYFQIASATNNPRYNRFSYSLSSGEWTNEVPDQDPGFMPATSTFSGEKLGIVVDSNEVVWLVYYHDTDNVLTSRYRTIGGAWTAGPDLRTLSDGTEPGQGETAINIVKWRDDSGNDAIGAFFTWDQDYGFAYRADADSLSASWTYELAYDGLTAPIGSIDNHGHCVAYRREGDATSRVCVVLKNGAGPDIFAGVRNASGNWGPLKEAGVPLQGHTECSLIVDATNDEIYVFYVDSSGPSQNQVWFDKADVATLSFSGTDTVALEDAALSGKGFVNTPQHAVTSKTNLRFTATWDGTNKGWNEFLIFPVAKSSILGPAVIRKPWTKQPPAGTPIDWSNPLTKNLVGAWYMAGAGGLLIDALNNRTPLRATGLNSPTLKPSKSGQMSYFQDVTAATEASADHGRFGIDGVAGNSPLGFAESNECTIIYRASSSSGATGSERIIDKSNGANGAGGYALYWSNSSDQIIFYADNDATINVLSDANAISFDGTPYLCSVRFHETDSVRRSVRVDGVDVTLSSDNGTFPTTTTPFAIGNWSRTDTNTSRRFIGEIDFVFVFNKSLPDAQVIELENNPWQIFKPRTITIPEPDELNLVMF